MSNSTVTILSPEQLGYLNSAMLGRGEPVDKDNIGYNKPDYVTCSEIGELPNNHECFILADRLIKYSKTQLSLDVEVLKATKDSYSKYSAGHINVIRTDEKGVWVSWDYNQAITNAMKKACVDHYDGYKWNRTSAGWECRWSYEALKDILVAIENVGTDVGDVLPYLHNQPNKEKSTSVISVTESSNKEPAELKIIRVPNFVNLYMSGDAIYNPLRQAIKSLDYWRYIKNSYWQISIRDTVKLYDAVKELKVIDLTELKELADHMRPTGEVYTLADFSHLKRQPRDFQVEDAKSILSEKLVINANEMGTGKTFETVMAGYSLPFPKLVICPASLRINWVKEIKMVDPDADITIVFNSETLLVGKGEKIDKKSMATIKEFRMGEDWTIIGWPSIEVRLEDLEACKFKFIAADEAHYAKAIKNSGKPDSKRAAAFLWLCETAEYVIPTTGTPKTNRNKDLYNLLKAIKHPMTYPSKSKNSNTGWFNFAHNYCDAKHNGYGWDFDGSSNDSDLHGQIKGYLIRHLKKDVLPNLKKFRSFLPVEIDLRQYNREIAEYMRKRSNKAAAHLAYLNRARYALASKKASDSITFAQDLIDQGRKVVIITCFTDVVNQAKKAFGDTCISIMGSMSDAKKDEAVTRFQENPDIMVCVANIVAGGVGFTLTAGYDLIMNDFDWTPGNHIQAEDRICRPGQQHDCNIYYMYALGAEMDEFIADVLDEKLESINNAIDGGTAEDIDLISLVKSMLDANAEGISYKISENQITKKKGEKINNIKTNKKEVGNMAKKKNNNNITAEDLKKMDNDKLFKLAKDLKVEWNPCNNESINRMRAMMAVKKHLSIA